MVWRQAVLVLAAIMVVSLAPVGAVGALGDGWAREADQLRAAVTQPAARAALFAF